MNALHAPRRARGCISQLHVTLHSVANPGDLHVKSPLPDNARDYIHTPDSVGNVLCRQCEQPHVVHSNSQISSASSPGIMELIQGEETEGASSPPVFAPTGTFGPTLLIEGRAEANARMRSARFASGRKVTIVNLLAANCNAHGGDPSHEEERFGHHTRGAGSSPIRSKCPYLSNEA